MMPYRFRRRMANPVKRDKHELTWSNLASDASSQVSILLARGTVISAKNTATETAIGSHVYSIYFEFHFSAETTTSAKVIHWEIDGVPPATASFPPASTYYTSQRAQIFKRGMEMLPREQGTVFKRVFVVKVPKKFQRQQESQDINFRYICTSAEPINACGIAIYKETY